MNKRNYPFDLARSICVLWIIGFWHMLNYFPQEYHLTGVTSNVCQSVTTSVLACFTFLSGYFLKKYEFNSRIDVLGFYKKRLIRFYPLFIVAVAGMVVCGSSIKDGLYAIVGLSMLYYPPIGTLWFFSMLLLFYLFTPLFKFGSSKLKNLEVGVFILVAMICGYFFADRRLIVYLPFYILGLNLTNTVVQLSLNIYSLLISLIVFAYCFCLPIYEDWVLRIVHALSGVMAILSFSELVYRDWMHTPVAFIAEASMCAYLFHRPIYTIIVNITGLFSIHYMTVPLALVSILLVFGIAYIIQKLYNKLIAQIEK